MFLLIQHSVHSVTGSSTLNNSLVLAFKTYIKHHLAEKKRFNFNAVVYLVNAKYMRLSTVAVRSVMVCGL